MNNLDFTFETSPWEQYAARLEDHDIVSASQILTLLEGESDEIFEDAFRQLEELRAEIDLSDMPRPVITGETGLRLKREAELSGKAQLLKHLEDTDPLRLYLEELASIPVCGDICVLAEELSQANDAGKPNERIREQIVNLSLSRVVEVAGQYTGWGVLLMDLIQEGSLGLWRSTDGFIGRGEDFEQVRDWWIRAYMAWAVVTQARSNGVGQKMRQALEDYRAVDERLLGELGRNPTVEEIAEQLHIQPEAAAIIANTMENIRLMDRVKPAQEPEEAEDPEDQQAVEDTAYFQMRQRIADLLADLSEEDAKLLTLRFGLEGGRPMSPEETGRRLALTPEEVVAKEAAALAKLRRS